ncbi:MAG: GreA/GreB family elongation factor [Clostridia bacterium]|nr:GreA/GreB family elongation factor [Clostridia bacterium]
MKKYFCKDGQIVYVAFDEADSSKIIVHYNKRQYIRDRGIIGKTLFEQDPRIKVAIGTKVLLNDMKTQEKMQVCMISTKEKRSYRRAGGAYYGANVEISHESELLGESVGDAVCVTEYSPLGKAIIDRYLGDEVCFKTPDGEEENYQIIEIIK